MNKRKLKNPSLLNPKKRKNNTYSDIVLNKGQQKIFDIVVKERKSVFFTGPAGSGKTALLNNMIDALKNKPYITDENIYVTASTGIAAINIGGTTLHSYVGTGLVDENTVPGNVLKKVIRNPKSRMKILSTKILIIDEVSMIHKYYFDLIDFIIRNIKKNDKPFGGIQVIITGDFYQLPPVVKNNNDIITNEKEYAFESKVWFQLFPGKQYELSYIYRQDCDDEFKKCLNEIRNSTYESPIESKYIDLLKSRIGVKLELNDGEEPTLLRSRNIDVDKINNEKLDKIDGDEIIYKAVDKGIFHTLLKDCMASEILKLKIGAQVMLIKNLDVERKLVNGSKGIIDRFKNGLPIVKFYNIGIKKRIDYDIWTVMSGDIKLAERTQIPLKLAYAFTIHKSQGMQIDKIDIRLDNVFESGQAYVALSRCPSLNGITITGKIYNSKIISDKKVINYYNKIKVLQN